MTADETKPPNAGVSVSGMLLGAASAASERIGVRSESAEIVVGVVADGRDALVSVFAAVTEKARRFMPAETARGALDHARTRGRDSLAAGRESFETGRVQVEAWLRAAAGRPVKWA